MLRAVGVLHFVGWFFILLAVSCRAVITTEEANAFIDGHNNRRVLIGSSLNLTNSTVENEYSLLVPGSPNIQHGFMCATNMNCLVWDPILARVAQETADTCQYEYTTPSDRQQRRKTDKDTSATIK